MTSIQLISQAIISQRAILELTQEDLAILAGCSVTTIRKIERGSCDMRISTAVKIAKVLDISLDECMDAT